MERLEPAIRTMAKELVWPEPRADGFTVLPPAVLRRTQALIGALINYIEVQLVRCKERDADPAR